MNSPYRPAYLETHKTGKLAEKIRRAYETLQDCTLCPRQCHVNRTAGETGICGIANHMIISGGHPHFGEESPLVGRHGSGTIFITGCSLTCCFCQNWEISHECRGEPVTAQQAADMMMELQALGCHNINFVTPTHVVPQILSALEKAVEKGLHIPLVYNCGGYETQETLRLLQGIIDIYMPDLKFMDPGIARRACDAPDYPETAKAALKEMHRQVGDLLVNPQGIAVRGLLVRHLVLPENLAGTREAMAFIAKEISPNTYVNIMSQYRPMGHAAKVPELARPVGPGEYRDAVNAAREERIHRLDRP
ncbi:MAG: radical SAM protein [Desulfosalsimonas sp.]|uniref:radical SAM protein n=1 Tax=Desulfosalsimonas sp. TaxID=3073848 RepID=UPI00397066E7